MSQPIPTTEASAAASGQSGQNGGAGQSEQQQASGGTDRGYPENTPVAEMTDAQRAAYYKHHNRQAENRLNAFKGMTPEQVQQMQTRLQELEDGKLNADQKALKDAVTKAANDAKSAADAEWRPKYQASELKSVASQVLKGEQLKSFMAVTDPAKFAGDDGEIDEEMVMGHLTAIFGVGGQQGGQQQSGNGHQQQPSWGQHSGGTGTPVRPGEAGRAEATKRFGAKTT